MNGRPWMPLYVADYLADTAHLSAAEHGAYLLLILHYWQKGGLPQDEARLHRITRLTARQWARSRDILRSLFGDHWSHTRVDKELHQVAEKSRVNSANAKRSHEVRRANGARTHPHFTLHTVEKKEAALRADGWPDDYAEQFWNLFPNKVGKQDAVKALAAVRRGGKVQFADLMDGLRRYVNKSDDRPWCNPGTWIRQGRQDDRPASGPLQGRFGIEGVT